MESDPTGVGFFMAGRSFAMLRAGDMNKATRVFSHIRHFLLRFPANQRGLATMEMAIMIPVLSAILMGTIDFGRLMFNQVALTNATREGARQGILFTTPRPTADDIKSVVRNALTNTGWDASLAAITVTGEGGATGSDLQVVTVYPFDFWIVSKLVPALPDTYTLHASFLMKME